MTDLDLARRAVAATGWRWMPGMMSLVLYRDHPCGDVEPHRMRYRVPDDVADLAADVRAAHRWMGIDDHDPLPDLDDPATIGCLLALVRERWGDHTATTQASLDGEWWMVTGQREPLCKATWNGAEAAALVAALEARHA